MRNQIGILGEDIASDFLISNGCKILKRNYRTRSGEIDIIAKNKDVICFVEVKTRTSKNFGSPLESVSLVKQNTIFSVASEYSAQFIKKDIAQRFDVISIIIKDKNKNNFEINWIKDAFQYE